MSKPPKGYYWQNAKEIDRRATLSSPPPIATPFYGAMVVGFTSGLIAILTLRVAGTELSDYRVEGVASVVSFICAGLAYLFFRQQDRAFWRSVERETEGMWSTEQTEQPKRVEANGQR
jgi:hypothetical protein